MRNSDNTIQNEQPGSTANASCEALIAPLRGEIVESEKARVDFLKYKLLAVAALGSIGLSLDTETNASALDHIYILGIIPFVCLYVDLLCHHNTMRILVIGLYFANKGCPYENFIFLASEKLKEIEPSPKDTDNDYFFEMEDWALDSSTILLSCLVLIVGMVGPFTHDYENLALIAPGFFGICLAILSKRIFKRKKKMLFCVAHALKDSNRKE
jgi:hypothetical protein